MSKAQPVSRQIGPVAAVAVVLGNIVGVMIFLTPAQVARHLPWDGWFLAAWILGGLFALLGALCVAELGAMMPEAGGDYVYIRRAFGALPSFLSGWTSVVITFPGSIAAMAVGLCFFQGPALFGAAVRQVAIAPAMGDWYLPITWAQILALGVILLLTGVNHLGVRLAGWLQTAVTAAPAGLMLAAGMAALLVSPSGATPAPAVGRTGSPWLGLFPALVPIFFAYAGWNATTYVGGEIRNPGRNIPRSLIAGTGLAIALYGVTVLVFLRGVPAAAMPGVSFVPAVAIRRLFGPAAASLVTLAIALAVLSSLNATVLAGARIGLAMAERGEAPGLLCRPSARFGTPAGALWAQAALSMLLVLTGRFEALVRYVVVVMLLLSSVAVASVVVLRRRQPEVPRPYRAWGYPVTPVLFVAFSLAVVMFQLQHPTSRLEALWGMGITALGVPVFLVLRRRTEPLGPSVGDSRPGDS